jgi:5-methylcytosine-specific restriction endonuclease McrA
MGASTKKNKREKFRERYQIIQGGKCYYCKEPTPFDLISDDHFLPKSAGHTLSKNRVLSCKWCNNIKGALNIYEYRVKLCQMIAEYLRRLHKKNVNEKHVRKEYKLMRMWMAVQTCTEIIHNGGKPKIMF